MNRQNVLFFGASRAAEHRVLVKALTKPEGRTDTLHPSCSHSNPTAHQSTGTDEARQKDALLMQRMLAEPRRTPLQRARDGKSGGAAGRLARARCRVKAWLKKLSRP
jgi:hypothetical protein